MPRLEALPYLTCGAETIKAEPWSLVGNTGAGPLPDFIKDWDPLTTLTVTRTVAVNVLDLYRTCGLSAGAEAILVASWSSPGTTLREQAQTFPLAAQPTRQTHAIAFKVLGGKVAGSIELHSRVLLVKKGSKDSPLSATRIGSILWQDTTSTRIEGLGARFPMEFADFSELGYPPHAGWRLFWKRDFHSQVMGNLCLLINQKHERLRGLLSGSSQDAQAPTIKEAIHFSIARDLIAGAVSDDEFVEGKTQYPKGSIGDAIAGLMRRVFGDLDVAAVRELYRSEPDRFDCQLQHALKLFHATALGS